jgi:hypothetical protein
MVAPLAGETVRASHYPKVRVIKKAANESVTSSTVFQDDDDFSIDLDAGKTYRVETYLSVSGATAGDIKVAWVLTGGAAQLTARHCRGPALATADVTATSIRDSVHNLVTTTIGYGTDNATNSSIFEDFLVETTTANASGTLTMQWAQNGSSATSTTMSSSSYMVVTEVDLV